jgi:PTH1 family peptidyl-tRNA hydrolase
MLLLAAFLGNPGVKYERTRHNAGFLLAEKLPFYSSLSWQKKYKGYYAAADKNHIAENLSLHLATTLATQKSNTENLSLHLATQKSNAENLATNEQDSFVANTLMHFIKPETFMNLSGASVAACASFFKIKPEAIIVIHDELELPLGTISLKFSGGLGGHNGLRSMKQEFGTADFWRLRIGIGRPDKRLPGEGGPAGSGEGIIDWVLSPFSECETETLNCTLEVAAAVLTKAFLCDPNTLLKDWAKKRCIESAPTT